MNNKTKVGLQKKYIELLEEELNRLDPYIKKHGVPPVSYIKGQYARQLRYLIFKKGTANASEH